MNPVTLYPSYVLILAMIHLLLLARPGEAFPPSLTIPNFVPYLPKSLFTWGLSAASEPQILETRDKNSDQKSENPDKIQENHSNEDWDWTALPPSVWTNLLTARNPERYWLPTKSAQMTEPSKTTKSPEPALLASAKPKTRKHRPRHSRKHPRHSHTKAVLYTEVEDQVQSTTSMTTITEIPIVKRTTKRPRSRNPLCYFTALPCAD
ncbi:hypothetical protein DdX_19354 [Ditylenchus destructor]|uniref:Uncharacterized protein n=1 Tax=Ditylenchus destructor TaxID=166010 RepID=A0AAD4QX76_9BILA|nr:hypothetical protein DdX_19354 [Ditylenchus destructor]